MKKKILPLFFVIMLLLAPLSSLGEEPLQELYIPQADALHALGFFRGTGSGFALNQDATRAQAAVMLVRLLGSEEEAVRTTPAHPFTDVPDWANAHVGYLYSVGLTNGVSTDKFGSDRLATPAHYTTFILRALGYDDKAGDFSWETSVLTGISIGLLSAEEGSILLKLKTLPRGVMVLVSFNSLLTNRKGTGECLLESLYRRGDVISLEQLDSASLYEPGLSGFVQQMLEKDASMSGETPIPASQLLSVEEIARLGSHVAVLTGYDSQGGVLSSGSGFLIGTAGQIATNFHVVEGVASMTATLPDGRESVISSVLAYDIQKDLAIVQAKNLVMPNGLNLGDSDIVVVGQQTVAIGNPRGLSNTVSTGIISSIRFSAQRNANDFQISTPLSPGSSGGPLFNMRGEVIGINYAVYLEGQNLNFAIPVSDLAPLMSAQNERSFEQFLIDITPAGEALTNFVLEEWEPNNSRQQADFINFSPVVSLSGFLYGQINESRHDLDYYRFEVATSGTLTLIGIWADLDYAEDLLISLRDEEDQLIAQSKLTRYETQYAQELSIGISPGVYYVVVQQGNPGIEYLFLNQKYGVLITFESQ